MQAAPPRPTAQAAEMAAAVLAVDGPGTGLLLLARAGPARDAWQDSLQDKLQQPLRRLPLRACPDRLYGGLDLAGTLAAGRPCMQPGLLQECAGQALLLPMAECWSAADAGRLLQERDRLDQPPTLVAYDEQLEDEETAVASALAEGLAMHLELPELGLASSWVEPVFSPDDIAAARRNLAQLRTPAKVVEAVAALSLALGVASLRATLQTLRVARALAALRGQAEVEQADLDWAVQQVLLPRATQMPSAPEEPEAESEPESAPEQDSAQDPSAQPPPSDAMPPPNTPPPADSPDTQAEEEQAGPNEAQAMVAATRAQLPPGLLAKWQIRQRSRQLSQGRAGAKSRSRQRGRPIAVVPGQPDGHNRLDVLATLRAAAPWQKLRGRNPLAQRVGQSAQPSRLEIRRADFRLRRYEQKTETCTIFLVDASGSAALHRLAEAKGAVELLLADCYVRRDHVAVIVFRGYKSELLLPPTRSLVRAKRSLAAVPGGGGTPLASALDQGLQLAQDVQRRGQTPLLVLMSDGRANVTRAGQGGRQQAQEEALAAARTIAGTGTSSLYIDTAPFAQAAGRELAAAMAARYLPLPQAQSQGVSAAVREQVA